VDELRGKLIFVAAILISAVAGTLVTYFLMDSIQRVMVDSEAATYAQRVTIKVIDNGLEYAASINAKTVRVIYWNRGGLILAQDTWVNGVWQLDLGCEDKPTSDFQGDKCDVIIKIFKLETDNTVHFEVLCGGGYVKQIYYDGQLKLDTSSGSRFVAWQG